MNKVEYSAHAKIPQTHALSVYFCGKERYEAGRSAGPVMQTQYTLYYVVSGKGTFRTKKTAYRLCAGQGFMALPDQILSLKTDGNDPWEYIWIGFDGTDAPQIVSDVGFTEKSPVFKGDPNGPLEAILNKLLDYFTADSNDRYNLLGTFYTVMAYLQHNTTNRMAGEKRYVERALDYIHHNYPYRIKIEDISRSVGLDRTYLFKLFVKTVGTAPQEYLIRYRLDHACEMLKNTRLSTAAIAASCGFRDAPSFCKHFKARHGISPMGYRKQEKEQ